ncbi:hypothetical protein DICPUDRAFT_95462 [Dictyostelium purpureum]|uniref:Uncharacterized protein n=1 Tax=Dictyostelium purpureum TaxID=5786 RepID=F0ZWL9_DICPU|nr:uncharacterized protein DICPUDRAFT_95462 [Dictyostelium purpureum]EGC31647.1 hypothetical protein DICPUDRAFT_95462 [Dictyostelium purpureum]|eukprot:XP_003291813.1 hypothetical protein DICPUDRAFT_95462 [Dictyostelium purpureum]
MAATSNTPFCLVDRNTLNEKEISNIKETLYKYPLVLADKVKAPTQAHINNIGDLDKKHYPEINVPERAAPFILRIDGVSLKQDPMDESRRGLVYEFPVEPVTKCTGSFLSPTLSVKFKIPESLRNKAVTIRIMSIFTEGKREDFHVEFGYAETVPFVMEQMKVFNKFETIKDNVVEPCKCGITTTRPFLDYGKEPVLNITTSYEPNTIHGVRGKVLFVELIFTDLQKTINKPLQ